MTFLTKTLPRRTVLRGLGATVALPLLDAMHPAFTLRGRAAPGPVARFQAFYVPNGMAIPYWKPKGEGTGYELSPILGPLASFKDQMIVLSGLNASWNYIHAGASGSFLTGTTRGGTNEIEIIADVSMDQLLARHFQDETQVPSLQLSLDPPNNAGACTGNLSCVYTHTLSWRSPTLPLPTESNPRAVFETLFGDSGTTDRKARAARLQQHKSLLDSVGDKLAALRRELGPGDQTKMEEYTEAIRDVERRIEKAEEQSDLELPTLEQPQGAPSDFEAHYDLMMDLQVLALQSDLTRVIAFMIGKEQSARPYPQIGVPEAHHPLSHHNDDPTLVAHMSKINAYHTVALLALSREAAGDARRRRQPARQHHDPLRVGPVEQHAALGHRPAADARRRRGGPAAERAPHPVHRRAVDGEPARHPDGQDGRAGRAHRRQHRRAARRHADGSAVGTGTESPRRFPRRFQTVTEGCLPVGSASSNRCCPARSREL